MNQNFNIKKNILSLLAVLFFILLLSTINTTPKNLASNNQIKKIDLEYATYFSDDRTLVGASHNIFVAKVTKQVRAKERGIGPETQFEVEVIDNIKGNLKGNVTLDQMGGYKDGVLYVVENNSDTSTPSKQDQYLLKVGSTYLFSTRYNPKENWYTLNPYPTASKLISTNAEMDNVHLKNLAQQDSRVKALIAAYPNEVLIDADVRHNNALNSYASTLKTK
jgi:hypothetical protein